MFNEGYSATAGDDWMRPALCEEALRLGRILAELAPDEPEVHGLVALMEIQASRAARAQRTRTGEPVLLLDQDRGALGPAADPARAGGARRAPKRSAARTRTVPLQAAIAACHARAAAPRTRTGTRIAGAVRRARRVAPSPVVELNRAVAVAMAYGPAAGLEIVDALAAEPSLSRITCCPRVRGDLLDEARPQRRGAPSRSVGRPGSHATRKRRICCYCERLVRGRANSRLFSPENSISFPRRSFSSP